MSKPRLELRDVAIRLKNGDSIIDKIDLTLNPGEIHAVMGPNGSGKSTLAQTLMGHPAYELTSGAVLLDGEEIQNMPTEERAQKGMFLSFQNPVAVPGVSLANTVRRAARARDMNTKTVQEFKHALEATLERVGLSNDFMKRGLNDELSGGERKKTEIAQASMLAPSVLILDEVDSGLDVDALRDVVKEIRNIHTQTKPAILVITHYARILKELKPDHVHILKDGKIVKSGGPELAETTEKEGYKS